MYNYNEYNRDYRDSGFNSNLFDFNKFSELTEGKGMSLSEMIDTIHEMERSGDAYVNLDSPLPKKIVEECGNPSVKCTVGATYDELQTYDMGLNVYRELGNMCSMVVLTEGNSVMDLDFARHVMDLKPWEEPFQEHKIIAAYKLLGYQNLKSKKDHEMCEDLTMMEMVEDFFDCYEPESILITRTKLRYWCDGREHIEDNRKDDFRKFVFKSTNVGGWKNYGDLGEIKVNCDARYIPKVEEILENNLSEYKGKYPRTLEVEDWTVQEGKVVTAYSLMGEEILESCTPLMLRQAGVDLAPNQEIVKAMTSDENLFTVMLKSNLLEDDFVTVDSSLPSRGAHVFKSIVGIFSESVNHSVDKVILALKKLDYDIYIWEEDRMTKTYYDELLETHKDKKGFIQYFQEKLWFRDELEGHYWKLRIDSRLDVFPKLSKSLISTIEDNESRLTRLEAFELKESLNIPPGEILSPVEYLHVPEQMGTITIEDIFQEYERFDEEIESGEPIPSDYSERHFSDVPSRSRKEAKLEADLINNQVQIGTIASVLYEYEEEGPHHIKEFTCVGTLSLANGDQIICKVFGGVNKRTLKSAVITCMVMEAQDIDRGWKQWF